VLDIVGNSTKNCYKKVEEHCEAAPLKICTWLRIACGHRSWRSKVHLADKGGRHARQELYSNDSGLGDTRKKVAHRSLWFQGIDDKNITAHVAVSMHTEGSRPQRLKGWGVFFLFVCLFDCFWKEHQRILYKMAVKDIKMRCGRPGLICLLSFSHSFNLATLQNTTPWSCLNSSTTWVAMFFTTLKHHIVTYYSSTFITFSCVYRNCKQRGIRDLVFWIG